MRRFVLIFCSNRARLRTRSQSRWAHFRSSGMSEIRCTGAATASGDDAGRRAGTQRPVSAGTHGQRRWRPVEIMHSMVNIHGGYNTRGEPARSIEYTVGNTSHTFVALDKNAPWFRKGVAGPAVRKGDLKAVQVMQMMRHKLNQKLGLDDDNTAVADTARAAVAEPHCDSQTPDADVDPMDAMDDLPDTPVKASRAPKKLASRDPCRAVVMNLEVPLRPPCVAREEDGTTVVCVYKPPSAANRGNIMFFLRADGIDWLLAYAADERFFQGVKARVRRRPSEPEDGNIAAVAGLRLEFNFGTKCWAGTFVAGPSAGTKHMMAVNHLTQDMWARLRELNLVNGYLSKASFVQKKNAVKSLMTLWGKAIIGDTLTEYNAMFALSTAPSDRPRGEKRRLEDTVVTAGEACLTVADGDAAVADVLSLDGEIAMQS